MSGNEVAIFVGLAMIGILVASLLQVYLQHKQEPKVLALRDGELSKMDSKYPGVFGLNTGYEFYTDGHPYVWVSVSYEDFQKKLRTCCIDLGNSGSILREPIYSIDVDYDAKRVCIHPQGNYDFSKLQHYDQWVSSSSDIEKNIQPHNNS
jgi:hypothetical protein|tara:strand:+ start:22 stop:471 length:450 start_codon:yes stop_codon:yes gene_type:complete